MVGPHKAIIISSLQHRRQSLAALLRSMPEIGEICESDNTEHLVTDHYFLPSLILFDCWLDDINIAEQIRTLRMQYPEARYLAVIKQNSFNNQMTSADAVLMEGFSVEKFFQTVRYLVNSIALHF